MRDREACFSKIDPQANAMVEESKTTPPAEVAPETADAPRSPDGTDNARPAANATMGKIYARWGSVGFYACYLAFVLGALSSSDPSQPPDWLALIGLGIVVSLVFMGLALAKHKVRRPWFFWSALVASAVSLTAGTPIYFILGLCGIAYLLRTRKQFFTSPNISDSARNHL